MKKVLFVLLSVFILSACSDGFGEMNADTKMNKEFQEQAEQIGEQLKEIYNNGGSIDNELLEQYSDFIEINEVSGRELTSSESLIQNDLRHMVDFINGDHTGEELTFEKVYKSFELSIGKDTSD